MSKQWTWEAFAKLKGMDASDLEAFRDYMLRRYGLDILLPRPNLEAFYVAYKGEPDVVFAHDSGVDQGPGDTPDNTG